MILDKIRLESFKGGYGMNRKRIFALGLVLLLLLTLFGGCSSDFTDNKQSDMPDEKTYVADNEGDDSDNDTAAPVEVEVKTITILNPMQLGRSEYTFEEALAREDALLLHLENAALNEYGLVLARENVDSESYLTTLNGYIAANTLPDVFQSGGLAAETLFTMVDNEKLARLDDVFAYSDGTAYQIYYEDGCMALNRPANMLEDGNWYWFNPANCNPWELDIRNTIDNGYFTNFGVFTIYPLCIRYDWLTELGLTIPETMDELFEALLAMKENDSNQNGAADERAMFAMGIAEQYRGGICNYFGLHQRWQVDVNSGKVMLPELEPGFIAYVEFCKKLYDANLAYMQEGSCWSYAVDLAGDFCSAHVQYPSTMQFPETGDPDATYLPVPPIQAVEGIKPTYTSQAIAANLTALSFRMDADYEACGRFLDFINGRTYCTGLAYGVEGVAWEVVDGRFVQYDLTEEQIEEGYGNGYRFMLAGYGPQVTLSNLYFANATYETSVQETLDNGTTESEWGNLEPTHEAWVDYRSQIYEWVTDETPNAYTVAYQQILDFGPENILFTACDTDQYLSFATVDETAIVSQYSTDLTTYLDELCSNLILGITSPGEYEDLVQYAYDHLGLQEVMDVYQSRANRTLEAMGLEPVQSLIE